MSTGGRGHGVRAAVAAGCLAALAIGIVGLVGPGSAGAGQGTGNPVLSVSSRSLPATQTSTITVSGSDYLVPPHAPGAAVFGGVYVLFGWTQPGSTWGPSARSSTNNNGVFGVTYSYPGESADAGTRDDGSGTTRLVSFTVGGESGSSTAFHMDDAGNWSTTLTVRGSTYQFKDPATGQAKTVDCRQAQCGVYTIGAHGKASATNERFVPISFVGSGSPAPVGPAGPGGATVAPPAAANPSSSAPGGTGSTAILPATGPASATGSTTSSAPPAAGDDPAAKPDRADRAEGTETDPIAMTASPSDEGGGSTWRWIAVVAALLVVGIASAVWVRARRRRAASSPA